MRCSRLAQDVRRQAAVARFHHVAREAPGEIGGRDKRRPLERRRARVRRHSLGGWKRRSGDESAGALQHAASRQDRLVLAGRAVVLVCHVDLLAGRALEA